MSVQDFLVEIGTEELPPKALKGLASSFLQGIETGLQAKHLAYSEARVFAAPRRLAVLVSELNEQQADIETEMFGPPIQAAFDDQGNPTKAAEGFARKCNTSVDQLQQVDTGKGVKLAFKSVQPGQPSTALLPEIIQQSLDKLPIPKRMRWGSSRVEFVRPVKWLVMLMGDKTVDCEILGQKAGKTSFGHRFHFNQPIEITSPQDYQEKLRSPGYVVTDFEERRSLIKNQIEEVASKTDGQAVIDEDLLDEVTALVEWPVALVGRFDEDFLRLPPEALISSMKEHQKYFHMVDFQGRMLPNFITLSNIESKDPQQVIAGNERVIRPRLADAAFFFDTDRKTTLESRLDSLKNIVFQSKLGTVYEKSSRVSKLAANLANQISGEGALAERAGLLCKTDLVTQMVGEFPDLQGLMGQQYAQQDGEPELVSQAIYEHYLPRFSGDILPNSKEGCAVSIADKLDTITGLFAIGQPPTGDKDPFALRRAALGILRIIVEKKLDLDLLACIESALALHDQIDKSENIIESVFDFMLERFRAWFQDEDIPASVFQAVHARRPSRPLDFQRRIYAVNHFASLAEAETLSAANKRVSNILSKQGMDGIPTEVSTHLLKETAEQKLAQQVAQKEALIAPLLDSGDYTATLESLAELRPSVDEFFDNVMVMTEDDSLRQNRLSLLQQLRGLFLKVADISLLQSN